MGKSAPDKHGHAPGDGAERDRTSLLTWHFCDSPDAHNRGMDKWTQSQTGKLCRYENSDPQPLTREDKPHQQGQIRAQPGGAGFFISPNYKQDGMLLKRTHKCGHHKKSNMAMSATQSGIFYELSKPQKVTYHIARTPGFAE